jgi:single-stranded-DNA-specific exonuclease
MMQKRWVLKKSADAEVVQHLSNQLNIQPVLANLLVQRGIETVESAKRFFRPELSHLHDPFLMKDMDKAINRLNTAFANKEKILVFGDYDVDGTTAVALVYSFIKSFYESVAFYIPDRYSEGYGISFKGIDYAKENGYSLIIALDCGIKANDKVDYANSLNIDFVICDHHRPGEVLPAAIAVLDPKRVDCDYPYDELSGCGLGFKLVQAFAQKNDIPFIELMQYLDLVAVSIAADIVPLTGENRTLAYFGLQRLNKQPRPGFKAIMELSNVKKDLSISDIVFTIGPRINAAGRIENGGKAVELLISPTKEIATQAGIGINISNTERKTLDHSITEHALQMMQELYASKDLRSTVIFHPEWHKGVIGIVASRLTEKYYRPTIVLTQSNGMATGSARSVKDFDIYNAIEACSELLEQFGGHKFAAGLTLKPENVPAFQEKFETVVAATIEEYMLSPEVEIDAQIRLAAITPAFYAIIKQMAPFGPGNMAPVFKSSAVSDAGYARVVGANHLKLSLYQEDQTKSQFDAIAFQRGEFHSYITRSIPFDVCYSIEENEWNGKIRLQLNVKEIAV